MTTELITVQLTRQELQIVALFRQELEDEPTVPEQWRLIVNAAPGEISSQFERVDRVDLRNRVRGAEMLEPAELESWIVELVRRQMRKRQLPTDAWALTVELSPDRIRAFRSRKGAKTLPKAVVVNGNGVRHG